MPSENNSKKKARSTRDLNADEFLNVGKTIMKRTPPPDMVLQGTTFEDRWIEFFGVVPAVVAIAWNMIMGPWMNSTDKSRELEGAEPAHILWALMFLKIYATEAVLATLSGLKAVDEKTFRKWRDIFVAQIAYLETDVVSTNYVGKKE
jgi:hypothetical protein